jgi:PadR family transcriptional regulator PadR
MYFNVVHMPMAPTLGEFEQMLLLAILRLEDNAYGVTIRREILDCTRREVSPGALYTTLDRLEKKGMVTGLAGAPLPERGGRARRFYTVTEAGRGALVQAQQAFQSLMQGLELMGEIRG